MSFMIFCNSCFETKSQIRRKFVITSCTHIFCEACIENTKNFCRVCNAQCKVLEINEKMPSDVKMFLDGNSVQRMVQNIDKITSFQTNQVKMYNERIQPYVEHFPKYQGQLEKNHKSMKVYMGSIHQEKQIMQRLKEAYRSDVISTNLFSLSSSSHSLKGHRDVNSRPSSSSIRSASSSRVSNSKVSLAKSSNQSQVSSPSIFSSFFKSTKLQQNRTPPQHTSNHANPQRNMFQETRQNLLENTLRHMQTISQQNYNQILRKQMKK